MSVFSNRLQFIMHRRNINQHELAQRAELTQAAVCHYVAGTRMPRAETVYRIARALEVTYEDLMGGEAVSEEQLLVATRMVIRNALGLSDAQKLDLVSALMGVGCFAQGIDEEPDRPLRQSSPRKCKKVLATAVEEE